jgi:hypothetical protein
MMSSQSSLAVPIAARSQSPATLPMVAGLAIGCLALVIVPYRIAEEAQLNHVSGAWAALADDFAHGTLYRPLVSPLGYGGTRDFPLHILLHGLLVKAGLSLRVAGHLISLASAAMLVAFGRLAFVQRRVPPLLSLALGVLVLAPRTAIMGAVGIRGDILPVALGVAGLVLTPRERNRSIVPSSILLSLAVLAKPTLIWAPAGCFLALLANGERRLALQLLVLVSALTGAGLFAAQWASHGNMLASFAVCGSGGGFLLSNLARAAKYFRPGELTWALGGVALTLASGRKGLGDPLCAAGLVCLPVTLFVFTSQGTHVNHLVDASVIGALAVGVAVSSPRTTTVARRVLIGATLFSILEIVGPAGNYCTRDELERAAAALPLGTDPVLSEQPWIPLLAGERAFAIDPYNILQSRRASPAVNRDFLESIDRCRFRAIVLLGRPDVSPWWYELAQFGPGFREHLNASYEFRGIVGAHAFYLPRCEHASASRLEALAAFDGETVLGRMSAPGLLASWRRSER